MEMSNIKTLLDKYVEAETSLAEEKELEAYFLSGNVAPELEEYMPLFNFYESERSIYTSENIEFKMPFEEKETKKISFYKWSGIAASVAIICTVFWFAQSEQRIDTQTNSINHELAMQNTQDLLLMMTDAVTNSKKQLNYLKEINQTKNQFLKN
mgnify:CR=1 FL=1